MLHGKLDYQRPAFGATMEQIQALMRLAEEPKNSEQTIRYSLYRSELGQPNQSTYLFSATRAAALEAQWASLQAAVAAHRALEKTPAPALTQLSELALALLRTLNANKAYNRPAIQRPAEAEAVFNELDAQGLLTQQTDGRFRLADAVPKLTLPRGKYLQFASG